MLRSAPIDICKSFGLDESIYILSLREVESDPTVQRMLSRRSLKGETRRGYIKGIRFFCQFYRMKPDDVLERFRTLDPDDVVNEFAEFFAAGSGFQASGLGWLRTAYGLWTA
jgi:hypothetical protein